MPQSEKPKNVPLTYRDAGVDIDAGNNLVEAIKPLTRSTGRPGADGSIGGFGGLFDLKAAGFEDPILVAANDGVGTKVKIAIETGIHDTIGIDLVAMCVNDLIVQGAEPLFFLDYFATGKLDPKMAEAVVRGVAEGCRQSGAALIGGETAEMPGLYAGGDYDLAGFAVGAAERGTLLPSADMVAGDVLIGLASSGAHSNGYSLIRKIVSDAGLNWHDPAPFQSGRTLGEAFLVPTRIYAKPVLRLLEVQGGLKGLAHVTGGGLVENIPRVVPEALSAMLTLSDYELPAMFKWLGELGRLSEEEMFRTFNCGIGMVLIADAALADALLKRLEELGENAFAIGHLSERQDNSAVKFIGRLELE